MQVVGKGATLAVLLSASILAIACAESSTTSRPDGEAQDSCKTQNANGFALIQKNKTTPKKQLLIEAFSTGGAKSDDKKALLDLGFSKELVARASEFADMKTNNSNIWSNCDIDGWFCVEKKCKSSSCRTVLVDKRPGAKNVYGCHTTYAWKVAAGQCLTPDDNGKSLSKWGVCPDALCPLLNQQECNEHGLCEWNTESRFVPNSMCIDGVGNFDSAMLDFCVGSCNACEIDSECCELKKAWYWTHYNMAEFCDGSCNACEIDSDCCFYDISRGYRLHDHAWKGVTSAECR